MTVQELAERITELVSEARQPLPERTHPLTEHDLVNLWHGDDHSTGYHHPFLVFEVLRKRKFGSVDLLRAFFYPRLAAHEVPNAPNEIIVACYENWERRRAAQARAEARK